MSDMEPGSVQDLPSEPAEKVLKQSEVNEIVGRAKAEAASRAVEQYKRQQTDSQPQPQHTNYSSELSEDRIRKLAAEEAKILRDQWRSEAQTEFDTQAAQRIVKQFYEKIAPGKEKYDDFESVTGTVKLERFPNTVQLLAEHLDNSDDVLYELSKNRGKLAQIETTAREFPEEALYDLKRLSDSIKSKDAAATVRQPNAPLSQQRPSNTGTDSGGVLSMKDLKAKYRA